MLLKLSNGIREQFKNKLAERAYDRTLHLDQQTVGGSTER
jgi:hypothetical protein